MNKLVVHIHDNTYIHGKYENKMTKMAVGQSCNRFQISLIRYLGLPHQQLHYFISLFKVLLKLTIIIHQHFHLLSSIVQPSLGRQSCMRTDPVLRLQYRFLSGFVACEFLHYSLFFIQVLLLVVSVMGRPYSTEQSVPGCVTYSTSTVPNMARARGTSTDVE
jgi:hypothetical protein